MKNLKAFAKANETLTKEALLTVKGGDRYKLFQEIDATGRTASESSNPLTETFTKRDTDAKLKELSYREAY